MKSATGCFLVLGALPLLAYPFVLLANIMGLAGQRSGNESFVLVLISYAFYICTTAYPLVYLVCAGFAVAAARKQNNAALRYAFGPIGYLLLLVGLAAIWSFSEMGISTLQELGEQGRASRVTQCIPPILDGGDGLSTTGCGVLTIGGAGAGAIGNASEAHNWEVKVEGKPLYSNRLKITVKNDRKSCVNIRILDLSGRPAQGFEDRKPPICLDGTITTSFFSFDPPDNGTYIIRVFAPTTPGGYWLKVERG